MTPTIMNAAADIVTQLLAGKSQYAIATAYIEFTNNSTAAPAIDVSQGQTYYAGLNSSGKDFLRVPIAATPELSSSDSIYASNVAAFIALAAGTTGYFGSTFSQGAGSTVIGLALVASPTGEFADDIVYARVYYTTPQAKLNGVTPSFVWPITQTA